MLSLEEMHPRLREFVTFVDEVVKKNESEEVTTKKIADRLQELIKEDDIFPDAYKQPNPEKAANALYPVYIAPDDSFSIASAVWDVGQATPIHDHKTWGVIGLIQGEEREIHYDVSAKEGPKKLMERSLRKGEVLVCCTTDRDVHEVMCTSIIPCVGIHVYGANIGIIERHVYDKTTGKQKPVVIAWDPVPFNA